MRALLSLLLLLSSASVGLSQTADPSFAPAFRRFWDTTGGVNWTRSDNWNNGTNVCTFYGVRCSIQNSLTFVVFIELPYNNIRGVADWSLFDGHSQLSGVNLTGNALEGPLPSNLGTHNTTRVIDLSFNLFSGDMPLSYDNFPNLESFRIDGGNNITSLTSLTRSVVLGDLRLGNNPISGTFFGLTSKLSMGGLTHLSTQSCGLEGSMSPLSDAPNLIYLDASGNTPSYLFNQMTSKNIQYIDISSNYAPGLVLKALSSNINMAYMNISNNMIKDDLANIAQMTNLRTLDMHNNVIYGQIPASVSNMNYLTSISLSENRISGNLPQNMFTLPQLNHVDMSFNLLTGNLPQLFTSPCNYIALAGCRLSGRIPPNIFKMKNLYMLELSDNSLEGSLPSDLTSLPVLYALYLSGNRLTGGLPTVWPNTVTRVGLDTNRFSGVISPSLCNLRLSELALHLNKLTGTIPQCIGSIQSLTSLNLNSNQLGGTIPESFTNLKNLEQFYMSGNQLLGTIDFISGMVLAQQIDLSNNLLNGSLPNLSRLSQLNSLLLGQNKITGNVPVGILGRLPKLQTLDLSHNQLTGGVPCYGSQLEYLDVSQNFLTVMDNTCYDDSPNLQYLDISYNNIFALFYLGTASRNIHTIKINNNRIVGYILANSDLKSSYGSITHLDISCNQLEGVNLAGINQIVNLKYLNLSNNYFEGSISPLSIKNLEKLDLSKNYLSGSMPLFNLPKLQFLSLGNNFLSSNIPGTINLLPNLISLDLSSNQFNGLIPEEIGSLTFLQSLNLSGNSLESIPMSLGNLRYLTRIDMHLNNLAGPVPYLKSNPTDIDFSGNFLTGNMSWMFGIDSLRNLDLRGNRFVGTTYILSLQTKLQRVDISNNLLSGLFPDLTQCQDLLYLNASYNNISGAISSLSKKLSVLDLRSNRLETADNLRIGSNTLCYLMKNKFECPLPRSVYDRCQTTCHVSDTVSYYKFRMHIEDDIDTFNLKNFYAALATITNSSIYRFSNLGIREGSVIIDTLIYPPTKNATMNEGSAERIVVILLNSPASLYEEYDIILLEPISSIPPDDDSLGIAGVVLIVIMIAMIVCICGCGCYCGCRKRRDISESISDWNQKRKNAVRFLREEDRKRLVLPPTCIKSFKEKLGEGNGGIIYKGDWYGTHVALKTLNKKAENYSEAWGREKSTHKELSHPHIIPFYGVWTGRCGENKKTQECLVFEYLPDGDVKKFLSNANQSTLPFDALLQMMIDVLLGLRYLHDVKEMVHCDLACRNLLLRNKRVVITDFGSASKLGDDHPYEKAHLWTAPEALETSAPRTAASDMWSFGVVAYEILTYGSAPLYGDINRKGYIEGMAAGKLSLPVPDICDDIEHNPKYRQFWDEVIKPCFVRRPEKRPTAAALLQKIQEIFPNQQSEGQNDNAGPFSSGNDRGETDVEMKVMKNPSK